MEEPDGILEREAEGQGMFVGNYAHALDQKRRLIIPSQWRAAVGTPKTLYVIPDVNTRCLCVLTSKEMNRRADRIRNHPAGDAVARKFARLMASQSDMVSWDSQGRIRVKDELLDHAELQDKVRLVGTFDYFELWNPEIYEQTMAEKKPDLREAAEYLGF